MKRFLIFVVVLCLLIPAVASAKRKGKKIDGGNILVGGSINAGLNFANRSFSFDKNDSEQDFSNTEISGDALMGFYLNKGFEIGPWISLGYDQQTDNDTDDEITEQFWTIGAQAGYFADLHDVIVPYLMLRFGYTSFHNETIDHITDTQTGSTDKATSTDTYTGFTVGPKLGTALFVTRALAFDLALHYDYFTGTGTRKNDDDQNDYDVTSSDYGIALGLFVFF